MTEQHPLEQEAPQVSWRQRVGFLMFVIPFPVFFLTPILVPFMGFSATEAAGIIGSVIIGVELVWFASIPLLGKEGFKQLKGKAFGLFRLRRGALPLRRHRIGLALFLAAATIEALSVFAVVIGYFWLAEGNVLGEFMGLSVEQEAHFYVGAQVAVGILAVAALYTLGAGFLDRLMRAFSWEGE